MASFNQLIKLAPVPKGVEKLFQLVAPLPPVIAETIIAYYLRGPERASWSLSTQVLIKSMANVVGNPALDIYQIQKQMNQPTPLPSNIALSFDSYQRKRIVVDYLKDMLGEDAHELAWEQEEKGTVAAEWIVHPDSRDDTVVYYLHGGAYLFGSPQGSHRALICRIAKTSQGKVFAINYRLSPQNQFPAALIDAVSGYLYLIKDHGINPKDIVIAGESAGGGLTLATLLCLRDMGIPLPAGGSVMSPWTDLSSSSESHKTRRKTDVLPDVNKLDIGHPGLFYTTPSLLKHPYVSPLFHPDYEGLPPILIQVGDAEVLVDEGLECGMRILDAGVPLRLEIYGDMPHVHQMLIWLKPARVALKRLGNFIQDCCRGRGIASSASIIAAEKEAEKGTNFEVRPTAFRDLVHVNPDGSIKYVTDEEVRRLIGARHIRRVRKRPTKLKSPPKPTMPTFRRLSKL